MVDRLWAWMNQPQSGRMATGVGALAVSALFTVAFIAMLLPVMYVGVLPAETSEYASGRRQRTDGLLVYLTTVLMVVLLIGRMGSKVGVALPQRAPAWSMIAGTALAFAGMIVAGAGAQLLSELGLEVEESSATTWKAMDGGTRLLASLAAGMHEEFFYLAVPVAVASLLGAWIATERVRCGRARPELVARTRFWAGALAGSAFLMFRIGMHTYQGPAPALGVLFWASVNLGLLLALRSVLPAMAAHVLFDVGIAGGGFLYVSSVVSLVGAAVLVCGVLAGEVVRRRRVPLALA